MAMLAGAEHHFFNILSLFGGNDREGDHVHKDINSTLDHLVTNAIKMKLALKRRHAVYDP
ncbi:hypothetical protein OSTOST_02793 [Ostertagia ostertagi]